MSNASRGVVYRQRDGTIAHLPLEEVRVDALVVDVSARVTVRQVFINLSQTSTSRAKYIFPLPAHAAVCAFEMHTSGGRRIVGEAKEKSQAKSEHQKAITQGKLTSLVENVADDVFTISLGSIPGEETVTTSLTYVMVLLDDDSVERIRLQIPMWVGQRYGPTPESMEDASAPSEHTRVRFDILVQTRGSVRPQDVSSPSHPRISVAPYQTQVGRPSRHRLSVKFRSTTFLAKDFVLRITAKGLDEPRCFVERDSKGTVAMQLTLLPKFQLPQIDAQEYLFLVDRSGSMDSDGRLELAKKTLVLLLRALPDRNTIFNVFEFDYTWHSLWRVSEVYGQSTLNHATLFVESLRTDLGGTKLGEALGRTLQTRSLDRPTVLFVLTDGEINSADQSIRIVADAVARAPPDAPLRVFTLGIGSTVSTATCLGIARAGNGECLLTTSAEGIFGKCSKLLGAGSEFLLKNVTIDWGVPPETIVPDGSPSVRFTATDHAIRQAPSIIASIYPGFRLVVFAIVKSDQFIIPDQIMLRAQRDGRGDFVELPIPVERVRFNDKDVGHRLVHTLAARKLIMELEDSIIKQIRPEGDCVPLIVDLGKRYQLASRYTSFVAIDGVEPETTLPRGLKRAKSGHLPRGPSATWNLQNATLFAVDVITTFLTTWFGPPPSAWRTESDMPGGDNPAQSRPSSMFVSNEPGRGDGDDGDDDSDATFTTLSSLEDYASSAWSASRPPTPPPDDPDFVRSPSPQFISNREAGEQRVAHDVEDAVPIVPSDEVMELARQMLYDGSFTPDAVSSLGEDAVQESHQLGVDARLWATILAIAYFQKHLVGQRDLLDGLVKKALIYAYSHEESGRPIIWLLGRAASFV